MICLTCFEVRTAISYVTVSAIRPIDIHEILAPAMDPLEDDEEEEEALDKQIIIVRNCFPGTQTIN